MNNRHNSAATVPSRLFARILWSLAETARPCLPPRQNCPDSRREKVPRPGLDTPEFPGYEWTGPEPLWKWSSEPRAFPGHRYPSGCHRVCSASTNKARRCLGLRQNSPYLYALQNHKPPKIREKPLSLTIGLPVAFHQRRWTGCLRLEPRHLN